MKTISAWVGDSFGVFLTVSFLDNLLFVLLCIVSTLTLFRLPLRSRSWKWLTAFALCGAVAWLNTMQELRGFGSGSVLSTVQLLYPFFLTGLFFSPRSFWKSSVIVLGGNLVDVIKYFLLILFFNFSYDGRSAALDLCMDTAICFALLIVMTGVFLFFARRRNTELPILQIRLPLYFLIVLTLVVFMTTMLLLGVNHSSARPAELIFTLANIPLFTGTAIYSAVVIARTRASEENYKAIVDQQIRHYEQMEKKNEELRIFRHDFPKQIRPLAACLHEGRIEEAEEMLRHFDQSIEYARPRYATGNTMLDTVLECAQQTAQAEGIQIVWQPGSLFPHTGIAPEDIYTIFPNALDNAVEACRRLGEPCAVTVSSRIAGNAVYVRIKNPVAGKVNVRANGIETTKADKTRHGFGIRSMKKAAAKYGSDNLRFTQENGFFFVDMELRLPEQEEA